MRPDNWVKQRNIFLERNQPLAPHYRSRQRDYEAGADMMLESLFRLAEESPTKTFTIDSNVVNIFLEAKDD